MGYNIFIDSDIILDVLLERQPFVKDSLPIFNLSVENEVVLYTSSSIILNVQYIGQKIIAKKRAISTIHYLIDAFFEIINPSKQALLKAYSSNFSDFEDAVQYYTVTEFGGIDYIITRNVKDYSKVDSKIKILTPSQFLNKR